jgi:hypothetical protein
MVLIPPTAVPRKTNVVPVVVGAVARIGAADALVTVARTRPATPTEPKIETSRCIFLSRKCMTVFTLSL